MEDLKRIVDLILKEFVHRRQKTRYDLKRANFVTRYLQLTGAI